jgi:3-deoxy-D-manno-octulosonic-acid transferase
LISRFLYSVLWHALLPLVLLRLYWRGRKQPAYRQHLGERFGSYRRRLPGPVIWLHAVSVGETRAAAPLVQALLEAHPGYQLLLTHMTPTGRATGEALFAEYGERVMSAYLPYDLPWATLRFLEHFRPRIGILMETELWPNLVQSCVETHTPLAMVNARLSARSARGYAFIGNLARQAFANLSAIGAQTEADEHRLSALGARFVSPTGNMKFDINPPAPMLLLGGELRQRIGARPVVLAASTREGEEGPLLEAFKHYCAPHVLLMLVPRHPQRFEEVAQLAHKAGLQLQRRSENAPIRPDTRVLLGDSMGEMFAYYSAATVALIGGSWRPLGGQNPIEASAVGCPVIVGPHTFNFEQICNQAVSSGAAMRAQDIGDGMHLAIEVMDHPGRRKIMAGAGIRFALSHRGATGRTMDLITPLLKIARPRYRRPPAPLPG